MRRLCGACGAALVVLGLIAAPAGAHGGGHAVKISVLSSGADQVSGGDALVRVRAPRGLLGKLRVLRNGEDVTAAFEERDGALEGLVDGLRLGANELTAVHRSSAPAGAAARQELPDHRADLLRPAADAVRVQDEPAPAAAQRLARRAAGRQPGRRRLPRARRQRRHGRLEPRLQRRGRSSTSSTARRPAR